MSLSTLWRCLAILTINNVESLYLDILNKHAPQKQAHIRGNQIPFKNEQWRKAIRHRNKVWKKFTHQRTDANHAEYKKQRNKCTSIRRKAIKDHFKNKSETDNPPAFWEAYRRGPVNKPMTLH